MKLSREVLQQGRYLILTKDLAAFKEWQDKYIPAWRNINTTKSFQRAYELGMDGTKLFDRLYSNIDPTEEALKILRYSLMFWIALLFLLIITLGSIGGVICLLS